MHAIKYAASGILFAALLQLTASSPAPVPVRFLSATDTNFDTEKRQAPGSIRIAGDDEYDPIVEIPKRDHINDRGEAPGSIRIAGDDEYDPIVEIPKRDHINSLGDESSAVKMYNPGTVKRADAVLGGLADCARKLQPDWPHTQLTKEQSATCGGPRSLVRKSDTLGAPNSVKSSNGRYELSAVCSTSDKIMKYFLFTGDFQAQASSICDAAVNYPLDFTILAPPNNPFGMIGSEVSKVTARRKIASTIWHTKNQKLNIIIGTQNLNMNGDAQAKVVAHNLCMDAVKYHGDTCSIGILGTQGGPKVDLTHQSQKAGTITWTNIKSGKPAIAFDFSLLDP